MMINFKSLYKSKWTSIDKVQGWRHYEISNVFKKKREVEIFSICNSDIKIIIPIDYLKDKSKWRAGWFN